MIVVIQICLMILLLLFVYQDLKYRAISVWAVGVYTLVCVAYFLLRSTGDWVGLLLNTGFVTILLLSTTGIVSLRGTQSMRKSMGLGDVLFLYLSTLIFPFPEFIIWLNIGLVFSLGLHFLMGYWDQSYKERMVVPLAGFLAVIFTIAFLIESYVGGIGRYIY